jgi:hypothetical protein
LAWLHHSRYEAQIRAADPDISATAPRRIVIPHDKLDEGAADTKGKRVELHSIIMQLIG